MTSAVFSISRGATQVENEVISVGSGRYAPSPTGDLHLGNLRTALIAWAAARSSGRRFHLRLEDLDRDRARDPRPQIEDLTALGLDWDGPIIIQSERLGRYQAAINDLAAQGLVMECFCSRRDIREAASAAHTPPGHYPGTCFHLGENERHERRAELAARGMHPALRLRPTQREWRIKDMFRGPYTGPVDAVVLQRGDGTFAYNLAVVVDDLAMGVDQIVRGDDLLASAPVHSYIAHELGGSEPVYGHVPLVLGPGGKRLAKRDGAVTLRELREAGASIEDVIGTISASFGMKNVTTAEQFLKTFPHTPLPREPWTYFPLLNKGG